jgi:SAM-dependent methyltransferase
MIDLYEKFAYDYDEFGSIEEYLGDEKVFFENLFAEHNIRTVLDCACGTGQHLFMLSTMGFDVSGSDYSDSMIQVACKNLKEFSKRIPLSQCDFRYLEEKHKNTFDAVVCLTTALPHLHSDEDLIRALVSMKNRLNKNGLLVLTQGITHHTLTLPPIEVIINREDFSRVFVKEHDDSFQTIHVLDLFHSPKRMESNQYDIVYRLLLDKDYERLLTAAGYKDIRIYGDYDRSKYCEESWRLIVVAQRG